MKHEWVDVRISRRTLWVGMQAYPLPQVTRVRPVELRIRRKPAMLAYGRRAGATVGLGFVGVLGTSCLGEAVRGAATALILVAVLLAVGVHTATLVRALHRPPLYVLSVATAGTARAALVSKDRQVIHDLVYRVVDAIDNPGAEFEIKVENMEFAYGDIVHGSKYGGDHVEGDKIEDLS